MDEAGRIEEMTDPSKALHPLAIGSPAPLLRLRMPRPLRFTDEELFEFCVANRELRVERDAEGDLEIMTPTGGETSSRNSELIYQLQRWAKKNRTGRAFDSSGGFLLPDGSLRSPDAAWVRVERLRALDPEVRGRFLPLAPDFVIELRSPTDPLAALEAKMASYRDQGVALGWLVDPQERRVHVYRPERDVEIVENPGRLAGDPELPGFVLELDEVWEPSW